MDPPPESEPLCTSPDPEAALGSSSNSPAHQSPVDFSYEISARKIEQFIAEQLQLVGGRVKLLKDLQRGVIDCGQCVIEQFAESTQDERNFCFLWAVLHSESEIVEKLLEIGAEWNFRCPKGLSALHIAALNNDL